MAEVIEIAEEVYFDSHITYELSESCGEDVPGTDCIIQCCSIENQNSNKAFRCNFEAQGTYLEVGTEEPTGNVFKASDFRTVNVYPYQLARVCFNFGKSTTPFWEFDSRTIKITPKECQDIVPLTGSDNRH